MFIILNLRFIYNSEIIKAIDANVFFKIFKFKNNKMIIENYMLLNNMEIHFLYDNFN